MSAKIQAELKGEKFFHGTTCKKCGTTQKYLSGNCVYCYTTGKRKATLETDQKQNL